jgi:hypothetical protein
MWNQGALGVASWHVGDWRLRTSIAADGVHMFVSCHGSDEAQGEITFPGKPFPRVREMYVRGDELHLVLPQEPEADSLAANGTIAGLEVVLLPILSDADTLVIESTLSIQTQWLDVEPTLSLRLPTNGPTFKRSFPSSMFIASQAASPHGQLPAVCLAPQASLLVDARDLSSLVPHHSNDGQVEFFGDFMEKGVIRKVQPWWIWSKLSLSDRDIENLADQLSNRPLPLAS